MQASQIRHKYKQILEEPQSQNSEDEWQIAYSQMARQRKKRILTEASPNKTFQQNTNDGQSVLVLKQKLAQSIANCKEHTKEIDRLKKQQLLFEEERSQWQETAAQYNRTIEEERQVIKQNTEKIDMLQHEISALTAKIEEVAMDRELQQKQSEYYRQELAQLKEDIQRRSKQFKASQKELKQFEKIKKQNEYLRGDVERLSYLIEQSLRFGKVSNELMKKHFLGKPHKELDYWFPQNLVGEVEFFLKKHQIGYGNKDFTSSLVKFIDKICEKSTKEPQLKIRNIHSTSKTKENNTSVRKASRIGIDNSTNKKHSYNLSSLRQQVLKSNTSSFWKASQSSYFNTDPPQSQGCWQITVKTACWEIITQFKAIVFELLLQKDVKRKKIKKMIDSMYNSVMEAFEGNHQALVQNEKKDQFSLIKLEIDDITTPLKGIK